LGLGRRLRATGKATEHVEEGLSSPVDDTTSVPEADPIVEVWELPARSEEEAPSVAVKEILEDDDDEHNSEVTCRIRVGSHGSLKGRARHEPWQKERQARTSARLDDGDAEGGGEP
jgi:hypothetical protein